MRLTTVMSALLAASACQRAPSQLTYEGANAETQTAIIAHGRRLADILNCTNCHAANLQGKNMSDVPKDGPLYSPNVTLKVAAYSDADLDRLIRRGIPKDGRRFWFMPVESYQFLSDADFAALVAYLRTVKPAGKPLPPFKFNKAEYKDVEQGILGDAQSQIRKYRESQPVDMGPEHDWGRYMAKTTCTGCHNNALQGWTDFTPNLDIAGAYSKAELTRLLTTGEGKTKKDLGAMSQMGRDHFSHLTAREREAIVDYILARANRPRSGSSN